MSGEIVQVSSLQSQVIVRTDEGTYTILDGLGSEMKAGDRLSWAERYPFGYTVVHNETRGESVRVFFQSHCAPRPLEPTVCVRRLRPLKRAWQDAGAI